jgi:hypothetical protein
VALSTYLQLRFSIQQFHFVEIRSARSTLAVRLCDFLILYRARKKRIVNVKETDVFVWKCRYNGNLTVKETTGLNKLFAHYKKLASLTDSQGDDKEDVIRPEGVFQFATDVGSTDDLDPLFLVIAQRLHCEHAWEFSLYEWTRGFSLYHAHDIVRIKVKQKNDFVAPFLI